MSTLQTKRPDGTIGDIVICDVCQARMHDEAIDWGNWDWSWQKLYVDVKNKYVDKHICARCRPRVMWCKRCQAFHYKNSTHKITCNHCGRKFRAFVEQPGQVCANCAGLDNDPAKWWLEAMDDGDRSRTTEQSAGI